MVLTTRNKLLLLIGAPTTLLLGYWLLRGADDEDDEEEETSQKMATSRQTVIDVKVPPKAVGAVIGRQGAMIKEIQQKSGARVNFTDNNRDSQEERGVVIRGTPEAAQMAENMIRKIIAELPVIVTEEMVVPGKCLGRIIGRNGETIRQMSRTSKAKVYVDRSAGDYRESERTVTITGTKENIELAKSMIQEKIDDEELFRAKKAVMEANREQRQKPKQHVHDKQFEGRTDMSSSNHDQANGGPESTESQQVHPAVRGWPEGRDYIEVYVSAVANPGLFWVQILSSMSVELDNLVDRITSFYTTEMLQGYNVSNLVAGDLVAAPFENDTSWYRAKVMGVEGDTLDLLYVDYGDSGYLPCNKVRRMRSEFEALPFQAIECHLAHIKPVGDTWSEDSIEVFDELTYAAKWKVLMAKKINHRQTSMGIVPVLELMDTNTDQDVNIAQEMVKRGYAVWDESEMFD
ncbi:tudor and KH domain-containing protein-like [Mytilus californianus]|uniref:tudor and KH domain-containing protein-like n=1 Tax=Mytilus californianus TaxID=6549 RepID=UPI002246C1CA|nr:tudor and KH domain-containing protein-like [Mytilus californianus]